MRTSEWVVAAYFLYLVASGTILRAPAPGMRRLVAVSVAIVVLLLFLAQFGSSSAVSVVRDWLPGAYVLAGYWATGLLYRGPSRALEARLESVDRELFTWLGHHGFTLPRVVRELLEFAYLCCYPLVPAGMAVLYLAHGQARADGYWTVVVPSTFGAYGVLPWAGTRPPRSLETGSDARPACFFRRVNLAVLAHASIQVNTFPSGHAASAWAVALFLWNVPGTPWPIFTLFAAAIACGAVAGRYHYALDVVAGMLVAAVVLVAVMGF